MSQTPAVTAVDRGKQQVARTAVIACEPHELFELLVDPHRHLEIDGSGSVGTAVSGPNRLSVGDTFSVEMKQAGVPYKITSTATTITPDRVVEWQHPGGHHWRWEFEPVDGGTRVTEIFDYRDAKAPWFLTLLLQPRMNAKGIESTLDGLQKRFAS
ncbi:SRPBCC family protein [Lysinibacter cavernae]|uniref:Dimethyladenosine transferase n=1 Tax=Lysinibacter cavernae TaxID=1640652 RepID=A0A7X5R0Q2_9MICO|nr:hypothetical protein [Lysinibacter cavernae]